MSPPDVWGPAVWILFHTLAEKVSDINFNKINGSLLNMIKLISKNLQCPYCAEDATRFLAKITIAKISSKQEFKNILYLFHNYVNNKKTKPLLNFKELDNLYKHKNLSKVIINFIRKYNTKGNMQLLTESFQRQFVIAEFKKWIRQHASFLKWNS